MIKRKQNFIICPFPSKKTHSGHPFRTGGRVRITYGFERFADQSSCSTRTSFRLRKKREKYDRTTLSRPAAHFGVPVEPLRGGTRKSFPQNNWLDARGMGELKCQVANKCDHFNCWVIGELWVFSYPVGVIETGRLSPFNRMGAKVIHVPASQTVVWFIFCQSFAQILMSGSMDFGVFLSCFITPM